MQGIETTITYDRASDELIVNTPVETAQKHWLGGALGAMVGVIFGQLYVDGENKGVHAAIVPMRDQHGALLPGVAIADCGHKQGTDCHMHLADPCRLEWCRQRSYLVQECPCATREFVESFWRYFCQWNLLITTEDS